MLVSSISFLFHSKILLSGKELSTLSHILKHGIISILYKINCPHKLFISLLDIFELKAEPVFVWLSA